MRYIRANYLLVFCLSLLIGIISTQCHCGNQSNSSFDSDQITDPDTKPKYRDPLAQAAKDAGKPLLADKLEEIAKGNLQDINEPILQGLQNTALHEAAELGNVAIIQKLLDAGADSNVEDRFKRTPLYFAISKGHTAATKLLLNQKNIRGSANDLAIAIKKGDVETVELLLAKNPTLAKSSYEKQDTVLHLAVRSGKTEIIKLLLKEDSTPLNQPNDYKETPLHTAIREGQVEVAKLLLEQGADIYHKSDLWRTPLVYAIQHGQADIVQLLLQKDPNLIRQISGAGFLPIHRVAQGGQIGVLQLLLDHGADINAKTLLSEFSPLHIAVQSQKANIDMLRKLLSDSTTNINAQDGKGQTPLYWAIKEKQPADVIKLLLEKGAKLDKKDIWLLNSVIKQGRLDVLKLLLNHGVPIDIQAPEAHQLWSWALEEGNKDIMQFLRPVDPTFTDLHVAARQGDVAAAKQLLQANPSLKNAQDELGNTPLHIAASHGHKAFVELLLEQGADVRITNTKNDNAYHLAGYKGQQEIQKLLEAQDASDKSLHNAVKEKNKEQVKTLIEKKPELIYAKDLEGETPFDKAIQVGDVGIIELFFNKDPSLIKSKNKYQDTPLLTAVLYEDMGLVQHLITKGADINAKDRYGNTPLLCAIEQRNKNIVELLVNNHADVNVQNDKHKTPLSTAIEKGLPDIVDLLLKKGADVNLPAYALIGPDFSVSPPLSLAILQGNIPIIQSLLDKHPDINAKNAAGRTPLCEAVMKNNKQVVEMLFQQPTKPDVNVLFKDLVAISKYWISPLCFAVRNGDQEMVELLITQGADVNQECAEDEGQILPLHTAIVHQYKDIVVLLLQKGANVTWRNQDGDTPLHLVAVKGDVQTAELLLSKNPAIINMQNEQGNTPLHVAVINEQIEMIKWLLKQGSNKTLLNVAGQLPVELATKNEIADLLK